MPITLYILPTARKPERKKVGRGRMPQMKRSMELGQE